MKQDQIQDREEQKKPRQKKADNDARDFGCPCGKKYLSYPALYTHIKSKHDGQPPGEIIKPKTQKTRGRPKTILVEQPIQISEVAFDVKEEVLRAIQMSQVKYDDEFQKSEGRKTCQDMASNFVNCLQDLNTSQMGIINCFLNELKQFINKKYSDNFWAENSPQQIIDSMNQFEQSHDQNLQKFPLEKTLLVQLILILFKWMHKNNWTPHLMAKKENKA